MKDAGKSTLGRSADARSQGEISNWVLMGRMGELAWKFRWSCLRVIVYHVLLTLMELSGLGLVSVGIDYVHHRADASVPEARWPLGWVPPGDWGPMTVLMVLGSGILVAAGLRGFLTYRTALAAGHLTNHELVVYLRMKVYDKLQRLSFRFYDSNQTGSIINRVTGDVQSVRSFIDGVLIQAVKLGISLTAYFVFMWRIHPQLTLYCLAGTPLLAITSVFFSRKVKPAYRKNRQLFDKMVTTLSENVQGVHVIKGFARQEEEIEKFSKDNERVMSQQWWIFKVISWFVPGLGFLTQLNIIVLLCLGGHAFLQGQITVGSLAIFAGLLQRFSEQVASMAGIANSVQQSLIGAQRVFEVLDTPVEIEDPQTPVQLKNNRVRGEVSFEKVTFGYRAQEPVLREVDFKVKAGQCVAIVGATGSGKSTLMSLIPRFYDPQSGVVRVDGIDVRDLSVDVLRRNIGVVFQESFLFSNTVAANIAFGHPGASMQEIEKAAKIAAAHEFIGALPRGYNTHIGERGNDLSGGQKQRLAIARAVLLNPAILLLDDPTAAIDPQTEHEIMQAMDSAMRDRTTFVVAHRLSTLRRADLIVVLEQGRIVQTGTHEELMKQKGHYQHAAALQVADAESLALLGLGEERT